MGPFARRTLLALSLFTLVACADDPASGSASSPASGGAGASSSAGGSAQGSVGGAGGQGEAGAAQGGSSQGGSSQGGSSQGGSSQGGSSQGGSSQGGSSQGGSSQGGAAGQTSGPEGPVEGYGALTGACGEIDLDDIASPDPQLLGNVIDFAGEGAFDVAALSPEGQAMVEKGNLGGSSLYSEVFAFEVLHRCDGAKLLKTEGEIVYATQSKKTDLLVEIDGEKVGVSVVRAMSYPEGAPYPVTKAFETLEGKLADIVASSASVAPADAWKKQILAVIAQTPEHADAIGKAYEMVDAKTRASTIVAVTVTEGEDKFIYYGK